MTDSSDTNTRAAPLLDRIRFGPEREMQESIFRRFGVLEGQEAEDARRQTVRDQDEIRATLFKLDERTASGIHAQLKQALSTLESDLTVELYLENSETINAAAHARPDDSRPCIITVTSGAIRQFDDQQLRMLFGHEIGHLHYSHSTHAMEIRFAYLSRQRPELLKSKLRLWNRLMEISADRAELVAGGNDFEAFFRSNILLHTGLGSEHLNPSLDDILSQIGDMKKLEANDQIGVALASHPLMPIRIRAAQLFGNALKKPGDAELQYETDEEIERLARLMNYEVHDPACVHERDLLLSGGMLLCQSDDSEEITSSEREKMQELVLAFTDDPGHQFERIQTFDQAIALLESSAKWIRENLGEERYAIFNKIVEIAVADGDIDSGENGALIHIAERLEIPTPVVNRTVQEALRHCQSGDPESPSFGLRSY